MYGPSRQRSTVTILTLVLGGAACSSSPTEPDRFPGDPLVSTAPLADAPTPPAGADLKMVCQDGPGDPLTGRANPSPTCPVIRWGGYIYWVFSDGSNGSSMTVVAYDSAGTDRHSIAKGGARYLWKIASANGIVTLYGQGGGSAPPDGRAIVVTWDELRF